MKKLNGFLAALMATGTSLVMANASADGTAIACESAKPIKFAEIAWDSGKFETEVIRLILERGYGCKTDLVVGAPPITLSALVAGNLDVFVEYWEGRTAFTETAAKEGKIKFVGELIKGGGVEGIYVPEYVVKGDSARGIKPLAPDLVSVADLPKYNSVFKDPEEPGKGRFINCPTGWNCEKDNNQRMKAYKLNDSYTNFQPGSGAALEAAVASANQRGQGVLFSYFEPSSLLGKYKAVRIKEPDWTAKCWATINQSTTDDVCGSASPSTNLAVAVSKRFTESAPQLVTFFSKVQFPMEIVNETISDMADKKTAPREAALAYLKNHPEVVKNWVPEAVATTFMSTLK